ncbi:MAG: hypothetical protein EP332_09910 [Bacteroidetes bacterium]|nr:MAG: hypothetical protein EP332_09910 [Bacteroidota bacterium]
MTVIDYIFGTVKEIGDANTAGMYPIVFAPIAFILGLINLFLIMAGLKLFQANWKYIAAFVFPIITLLLVKEMILSLIGDNREDLYWISLTTITLMNLIELGIIKSRSTRIE